jgi:5-methylcytosine-specific restriction endonuclease McrA
MSKSIPLRPCRCCGALFHPPRKRQIYCSVECAHVVQRRPLVACQHCGALFYPPRFSAGVFCSRDCSFAYLHQRKTARLAAIEASKHKQCVVCGTAFVGRSRIAQYCSVSCRRSAQTQRYQAREMARYPERRAERTCKECGKLFAPEYGTWLRTYCSKECGDRSARRVERATRRARERLTRVEIVDPLAVLAAYCWRCALCGTATPRSRRGTLHDNAPELDHIIPLALGGAHAIDNLQCLCRKCNIAKGATVIGQLRLF